MECVYNLNLKKTLWTFLIIYIIFHISFQIISSSIKHEDLHFQPVLVWWTQFIGIKKDRLITCPNEALKCLVTTNRTINSGTNLAAYLFYGSHIENYDFPLPRDHSVPWAVLHEESPKNYAPFLFTETQKIFNLTSTFSRYSDFPMTLQFLDNIDLVKDLKYYKPVDIKNTYLKKIAPVLYIQSDCDTPLSRDYYVKKMEQYIEIDSYGKCLTNKMFPKELSEIYSLDLYNEDLLHFISKYKFIIAFENSECDDYITEKLWRPLIVGSIPIYLGSPTIEDWLPNKNSAILVKNYDSIKDVADLIKKINTNDTLYDSFLEHKIKSKIVNPLLEVNILKDHPIPAYECFVCEQVHRQRILERKKDFNIYKCPKPNAPEKENTWYQHWEVGKCQSKALQILLKQNRPYSSKLFEKTWNMLFHERNC